MLTDGVHHTTLDNGLTILTREVHSAPVVSFWIWYRVGSRNERPGLTGLSHWVEHMLFKGTPSHPNGDFDRQVQREGGAFNGMTWLDWTAYYETLPCDRIDLAFRIEADRMVNSLFDPQETESERTVIISEREGRENQPTFLLYEQVQALSFLSHPYHHRVIGWKEDLRSITRADLYRHYRNHYTPNNAVVVAVGDFSTDRLIADITERFGPIPRGVEPEAVRVKEPPARGERRVRMDGPGGATYLVMSHRAPQANHPDFYAMVALDAILGGAKGMPPFGGGGLGRSARLYRTLVNTQLAVSASSTLSATLDPYLFTMWTTVHPESTPTAVEAALLDNIRHLHQEPVSADELRKAIKGATAQFAYGSESVTNQAMWLGFSEMVASTDWLASFLNRTRLCHSGRCAARGPDISDSTESGCGIVCVRRGTRMSRYPSLSSKSNLPGPHNIVDTVLGNGLRLLVYENFASETVVLNGSLAGGSIGETPERAGLANLTAAMLRRGTLSHSYDEINEVIETEGASFGFGAGRHVLSLGGKSMVEDIDLVLELMAESLTQPAFDPEQLELIRARILTSIQERKHSTRSMASLSFRQAIYPPDHPYHTPLSGYEETVSQITRDELPAFFQRFIGPTDGVLVVVGAISSNDVIAKLERTLGQWRQPQARPVGDTPPRPEIRQTVEIRKTIGGKSQSDILLGWPGIERTSPDYFPVMLCNSILGQFGIGGRLGQQVRKEQGMAYYAYSSFGANRGAGTWYAAAGVNPENVTQTIQTIQQEMQRIRTELVSDDEIADVKAKLTGSLPMRLETNGGIVGRLLSMAWHDLGLDYLQRFNERVLAVSKKDILRVARTYLDPDRFVLAIAGPGEPEVRELEVGDQKAEVGGQEGANNGSPVLGNSAPSRAPRGRNQ